MISPLKLGFDAIQARPAGQGPAGGGRVGSVVAALVLVVGVGFLLTKDAGNASGPGRDKEIEQAEATKAKYENMQNESKQYGRPEGASNTGAGR